MKNGENVYICHVKMIMKRQKLEKDVKITGHSIVLYQYNYFGPTFRQPRVYQIFHLRIDTTMAF